ncbi:MAG TPA: hypothetical protein VFY97_03950, partial [Rhodanobacteraceae bacterium]|nr:hypothetical protein [Rhodanobacteraceae bacterium]
MLARDDSWSTRHVIATRNQHRPPRWLAGASCIAALVAILALTWWAYHPGLFGAFLFDDLGSLPKLGATGPVDNWAAFWRYITSGHADPTGRPLALLTFLIDGNNWPTEPYPFKVTNVILHLINGALLAWVLWKLGQALLPSPSGRGWREAPGEGSALHPSPPGQIRRPWRRAPWWREAPDEGSALHPSPLGQIRRPWRRAPWWREAPGEGSDPQHVASGESAPSPPT